MHPSIKSTIASLARRIYHSNQFESINSLMHNFFGQNKKMIKGKQNSILINKGLIQKCRFYIKGNNNKIYINHNSKISNTRLHITGNNNQITIYPNCIIKGGDLYIEDNNNQIIIHDKTTIESAHIACTEDNSIIQVGRDCMIAHDVEIRNGDSHSIIDLKSKQRINIAKNIIIEKHVWIAAHVRILKGVCIGESSVIATESVVTRKVPPNTVFAGIPAKLIREGITWDRERI